MKTITFEKLENLVKEKVGSSYKISLWENYGKARLYLTDYTNAGNVSSKHFWILDNNLIITEKPAIQTRREGNLFHELEGYQIIKEEN